MAPTISQRLKGYFFPGMLFIASPVCKPHPPPPPHITNHLCHPLTHSTVLLQTALTAPKLLITDFKSYRSLAFAKLWLAVGKSFADDVPPPLNALLTSSRGVVLDVGPGAGDQVSRFSRPENISAIYGAEPGVEMHDTLRGNAEKARLGGKYRILSCGAQPESLIPALAKEGLLGKASSLADGVFDEIVCVRVLCGVPKLNETVEGLYRCLKPGGRFVVCEHVVNDDSKPGGWVGRLLQHCYTALGWSFFGGGCELLRDTAAVLMKAAEADGGWAEAKLEKVDEWSVVPHIVGYFVKRG